MEIIKYGSNEILAHIRHDLRELLRGKTYGNESIEPSLSHLNYSLVNRGKTAKEVNQYRKNLEKDIFKYNRKNLVHAVEVVIQCPSDCLESQEDDFFREALNYIASKLPRGEKDIFVASVHKDEKHYSPTGEMISKDHLHIMFCPAVKDNRHEEFDYKLCADALTKKAELKKLHPELQSHLESKGIHATVFQKKEGDGKAISLTVKQLKELTAKTGIKVEKSLTVNDLAKIISRNVELSKKVEEFAKKNRNLQKQIEEIKSQGKTWGVQSGWGKSYTIEEEKLW